LKDRVKIAVIGVGYLGTQHTRILSYLENAELIGVVDINYDKAMEIGNRHGVKYYKDYKDVIDLIDAAVVATPTSEHYSIAKDLIVHEKSVLVEKPITETIEQGEKLVQIAKEKNVVLQVGHLERFNPAVEELEKIVTEPKFIEVHRLGSFSARSLDIDVILDLMIHDLDIILALVKDEVKIIKATGTHVLTDKIDIANARLEFQSGCVANVTASRVHHGKIRKLRVFQPNVYFSVDYIDQEVKIFSLDGEKINTETLRIKKEEPLKKELENFLQGVMGKKKVKVTGEEGLIALKLAYQVLKEAQSEK
jgi:predicted dehydrogenase